jgi:hypothetical protein
MTEKKSHIEIGSAGVVGRPRVVLNRSPILAPMQGAGSKCVKPRALPWADIRGAFSAGALLGEAPRNCDTLDASELRAAPAALPEGAQVELP